MAAKTTPMTQQRVARVGTLQHGTFTAVCLCGGWRRSVTRRISPAGKVTEFTLKWFSSARPRTRSRDATVRWLSYQSLRIAGCTADRGLYGSVHAGRQVAGNSDAEGGQSQPGQAVANASDGRQAPRPCWSVGDSLTRRARCGRDHSSHRVGLRDVQTVARRDFAPRLSVFLNTLSPHFPIVWEA